MRSIQRTLALALALALGLVFLPSGCGGARGPALADAEVPEGVAQRLSACARRHADHLHADQTLRFDVTLANDGQVDEVALRSATLDDEGLEVCMASALRLLSEDDLRLRRAEDRPRGWVAPEARALMGQAQGLALAACASSPPCAMTAVFAAGVALVVVWIYVQPAARPGTKTHAPSGGPTWPATSASPMPTTYVPPMPTTLSPGDEDLWRKCNQQHDTYKKTQDDDAALAGSMNPIANLLHNNKASSQDRVDFCSLLDKRINLKQREHKERLRYMDLDCDRFDWFNTGLTAALRLARHQGELNKVDAALKNFYDMQKQFCP